MGSSLSDIPGAGGGGKRRRPRGRAGPSDRPWRPPPKRSVPERPAGGPSLPRFSRRLQLDRVNVLLAAAFTALLLVGAFWLLRSNRVSLAVEGLRESGAVTGAEAESLTLDFVVEPASRVEAASLELDGEEITDEVEFTDRSMRWTPNPADPLEEGDHVFTVRVPRTVAGTAVESFELRVDDEEPQVEVDAMEPVALDDALTITGRVDDADTAVEVGGVGADVDDDGAFVAEFDVAPAGSMQLVATDAAGNATSTVVVVPISYPGTRAIHLGADSWANESIRAAVLDQMGGDFDAVVLDVKDECGLLSADIGSELADRVGATTTRFDLSEAATEIQEAGGRAIARVVAFRDPALTAWAWSNGRPELVLQDTSSSPWPDFTAPEGCPDPGVAPPLGGGAAAFAEGDVRRYVLDVVGAAAEAGFDDVMLDDVRRPSGDPANLKLALPAPADDDLASDDPVAESLTSFLAEARRAAREHGAYLGATVSGLSVRDPTVYSQDLARFATAVDYLAPEIYPESYSSGFFNLDSPVAAPREAVIGALQEARDQLGDTPIELVPWLQDYSGTVPYGLDEIQAQVDGAAEAGSCSFVREDPDRNYTAGVRGSC